MLILTRTPGQSISIGEDITLTVISVSGNFAKIGIAAPRAVQVYREEIYNRIQAERLSEQPSHAVPE